jgi:hypothetical protein
VALANSASTRSQKEQQAFRSSSGRAASRPGSRRPARSGSVFQCRSVARLGLPVVDRPPYDRYMLRFHHAMKEDAAFQQSCRKDRWEFSAGSSWIVFTDGTSHAYLSGQYMLEQTFIVRRSSLVFPEKAPIAVLEKLAGCPLARSA